MKTFWDFTDELNELSGSKVGSYMSKASSQYKDDEGRWDRTNKDFEKRYNRMTKRERGINLATKKLSGKAKVNTRG